MRWLDGITDFDEHEFEQALGVGNRQEAWRAAVHGIEKRWTQPSN